MIWKYSDRMQNDCEVLSKDTADAVEMVMVPWTK